MSDICRRDFLKVLAFCFAPSVLNLTACASYPVLPALSEKQNINFDMFHLLAKLITNTHNLNTALSQKIFYLMQEEPWGPENLQKVYRRFREIQTVLTSKHNRLLDADLFSEDEQWFISHLLLTFYTGVYYHSNGNQHVTLQDALMYKKLEQYRYPPTFCGGNSGDWSKPPDSQG